MLDRVLVIIPVYHKPEQRDRCLDALSKQTVPADTFVHDNSADNIGYTKACNRGLRQALTEQRRFAMLLNQDCYPEPDAIGKLIRFMDEHPRCALAGPMQVDAEEPDRVINAGGLRAYPFGAHRCGKVSTGELSKSQPVAWVNGACVFARLEAVVEFGLMDEGMFLIGSDSDWSLTARMRGRETWHCAEARVQHEGGVSHAWPKEAVQRHFHQDMSYWRRKWSGTLMHRQLDRPIGERTIAGSIALTIHKASQDHQAGRRLEAELAYRDVLDVEPNNVDALNLLGVMELQYGMPRVALDLFKRAIALTPNNSRLHSHAGAALVEMAENDEGAKQYAEAVRLETQSPELLDAIAVELAKINRPEDAAAARAKAAALRGRR